MQGTTTLGIAQIQQQLPISRPIQQTSGLSARPILNAPLDAALRGTIRFGKLRPAFHHIAWQTLMQETSFGQTTR